MRLLMLLLKLSLLILILLATLGVIGLGIGFVYLEQRGEDPLALVKEVKENPRESFRQLKDGVKEVPWRERAEELIKDTQQSLTAITAKVRSQFPGAEKTSAPEPPKPAPPPSPSQPQEPLKATIQSPASPRRQLPRPPADIARQLQKIFPEMNDRQIREAYRRNQLMGQTE